MTSNKFCVKCGSLCKAWDRQCNDCGHKFITEKEMEFERQKLCDQTENDDE